MDRVVTNHPPWTGRIVRLHGSVGIAFKLVSENGEMNFAGKAVTSHRTPCRSVLVRLLQAEFLDQVGQGPSGF